MNPAGYRPLQPGDTVGVIAPAGPASAERVAAVAPLYRSLGLQARLYPSCYDQHNGYLAGTDERRLADLHAAFADPSIAMVHCLRGGYGSARLLDRIDVELLRRHAKPLIGYSDITALHALCCHAGLPSLHAPMPASDLVLPEGNADAVDLVQRLSTPWRAGNLLAPQLAAGGLRRGGVAQGQLVGGNLSIVASLLGTRWAWPMQGAILFLEDVSEAPYKLDRLLTQLRLAGVLDAVSGLLLGSFSGCEDPGRLLAEMLLPLGKPVLGGWPAGHGAPNRVLPLGVDVTLDAHAGTLTLAQDLLVRR